jgi:hypothetical protein
MQWDNLLKEDEEILRNDLSIMMFRKGTGGRLL